MTDKNPSIGIVIVNYNGAKYQNAAIKTIKEQTYQNYQIVVVDSASTDDSVELLVEAYGEDVTVLREKDNCGFAAGSNIGIRYCREHGADYILLLNNDVELDSLLLEKLVADADENTVVVPKIYFYEPSDRIWAAGGILNWNHCETKHYGIEEKDIGQCDERQYVNFAPACCMLLHRSVFERVGYFDEAFFMYYEDTDLCVRLLENGYQILYEPEARMWHKVSSSSGGQNSKVSVYYIYRNQLYFMKKHSDKARFRGRCYAVLKAMTKAVTAPVRRKNDGVIFTAYLDYLKGKMYRKW